MSDIHPHRRRAGFIEHTLEGLRSALERALYAETAASSRGLLQKLDPRVKVVGLFSLIVSVALAAKLWLIAAVIALAVALAALSAISLRSLASRAWIAALIFSGTIAAPALFLTPGTSFHGLPITVQGLRTAGFLVLRAEAATTLMLVLVSTTPWMHVLKALRIFRVPVVFVVILGMTCRYILLLLETAHEMFESRKSRTVNAMTPAEHRRLAVAGSGVLLGKTLHLSGEVYLAMQARGFRGEVYLLDDFQMRRLDWLALGAFALLASASIWAGH
jgi:cobalt/nickel transport system permease protein